MRNLIVLSTLLLLAPTAHAFDLKMETGAFVGGHFFSDTTNLGRDNNAPTSNQLNHSAVLGFRIGFVLHPRLVLEGELALAPTGSADGNASVLAFGWRAHLRVDILTGRIRPFVLAGGGGWTSSSSNSDIVEQDTRGELHAGAGLMVDIGCQWGLRLDGRAQFGGGTDGGIATDGELLLSLYGVFGKHAADGANSRCLKAAAAIPDADGDGIPDSIDQCPGVAGVADNHGCPDKDTDGDGVVDRLDKCPSQPGPKENAGCAWPDSDGDGVSDNVDKCPDKAGPVENQGCPWPDSDGDGILDKDDKCPNQPETKNGYQDEDGCPDEVPAAVKAFSGKVEGISFANGKAVILPSSFAVLDKATQVLKDYPTIKLEIQGHTDDVGPHDKNVALSQARADAVQKYLVDHGVEGARLSAKGYGPDKPIADNKTKAGKAQNRRVEFQLVQ
ncbi:MAG TPA: OmpA family protein [Polyangia bacterium]